MEKYLGCHLSSSDGFEAMGKARYRLVQILLLSLPEILAAARQSPSMRRIFKR